MPTKHPRIAVTRDEELDRALRETKALLEADEVRSASAQVRALALRGARSLGAADAASEELWDRLEREHGVRRPNGNLADLGPPPGEFDPDDPTPATDALNWVRGD